MPIVSMPVISMVLIDRPPIVAAMVMMMDAVPMVRMMPMAVVVPRMSMAMAIVGKRRVCSHEKARYPNKQ